MKYEVFKHTSDDFCGTFFLHRDYPYQVKYGLVRVVLSQTGPHPPKIGKWCITVEGNDDFGLSKDFETGAGAMMCFWDVIKLNDVTIEALHSMEFKGV